MTNTQSREMVKAAYAVLDEKRERTSVSWIFPVFPLSLTTL